MTMQLRVSAKEASALPMSNVLALDQSSRITGWSVFKDGKLEAYGKFNYESYPIEERLYKIRQKVQELIIDNKIDEVIMEDIQMQNNVVNNVQTFKVLAEVFGVISELCVEMHKPQYAVLASSWKHTLGIKGKDRAAQKRNAQEWVVNTYGVKPTQDIVDSICIGVHFLKNGEKEQCAWA